MHAVSSILEKILQEKRREVSALRENYSVSAFSQQITAPALSFTNALLAVKGSAVIAEIKRASPSKGAFALNIDPVALARQYIEGGATCISVLTDSKFFSGSLDDLKAVRAAEPNTPILRKDFIIDPIQIWQSRACKADCILLIVAALEDQELLTLAEQATSAGLDFLVEVHNDSELIRALRLAQICSKKPFLLGINNRSLSTFTTDLATTQQLMQSFLPLLAIHCPAYQREDFVIVSESGIFTADDLRFLRTAGADAFLVGESLVRSDDPKMNLKSILGEIR